MTTTGSGGGSRISCAWVDRNPARSVGSREWCCREGLNFAILLGAIWIGVEVTSGPAANVVGALASIVGGGALIGALIFVGELWITRKGPPPS